MAYPRILKNEQLFEALVLLSDILVLIYSLN